HEGTVTAITMFKDKNVILVDDMISTGTTMVEAARLCKERGCADVYVAATHGVFSGQSLQKMNVPEISQIIFTDTIPPNYSQIDSTLQKKAVILSVAELLAKAILNIHDSRSVSSLFI
ncbi:MAG: phosphoribosyltransferase family protein, partial [Planctomycetota bacterium]